MEAYIGYANFTMNAYPGKAPSKPEQILQLEQVYKNINPQSIRRPSYRFVKSFTLDSIEVCSASRGCTPKTRLNKKKHNNYLTLYKNGEKSIKTNKNKGYWVNKKGARKSNYILLNIKGTCKIGDIIENVAIRVPQSGVVGVKVGLSMQKEISVKFDGDADQKVDYLGYELEKIIYDLIPVPPLRPRKLASLSIQGFNLSDPGGGSRPPQRIKNFLQTMRNINEHIRTHNLDFEPSETKTIPRANFRSALPGEHPTFGITTWLMVDFTGVKSISNVRKLSRDLYNVYRRTTQSIIWNNNYTGPIPKSRRGMKSKQKTIVVDNKKQTKSIPVWDKDKKKYYRNGKVFHCMQLSKTDVTQLAKSLNIISSGFKTEICEKIMSKIKK